MPLDDIQLLHDVTPETAPQVMERIIRTPKFIRGVSLEDIQKAQEVKNNLEEYLTIAEPLALRLSREDVTEELKEHELPGSITGIATHFRGVVNTMILDMRNERQRILKRVPMTFEKDFEGLLERTENVFLALSSLFERTASETFYEHIGAEKLDKMTEDLRTDNTKEIGDFDSFEEFDALMKA